MVVRSRYKEEGYACIADREGAAGLVDEHFRSLPAEESSFKIIPHVKCSAERAVEEGFIATRQLDL